MTTQLANGTALRKGGAIGRVLLLALLLSAGAALAAPASKAAQPEGQGYLLDPVVVTARGYAASQSDTPGGVGVVTEEDIRLARKGSLVDALEKVPGITRTGDSPWGQDISIRGLSGTSVVILLNGKRLNTATDLNARLGFINPADIERVEVLKGPISALYGSGSTGGVVNIITKKPVFTDTVEAHGEVSGSAGTNPGGASLYGNGSVSGSKAFALASGGYRDYGNVYGGHDTVSRNSGFLDHQIRGLVGIKPWSPLTLTFEAMQSEGNNIGIPGGSSAMPQMATVTYKDTEFRFFSADADLDVDGEYLKSLTANFYYSENKRNVEIDNRGNTPPVWMNPRAKHTNYGGKTQGTLEAGDHTIVTGSEFWVWEMKSRRTNLNNQAVDRPAPDSNQTSVGIFAEDNWLFNDSFTLNLGARLDYLNTHNEAITLNNKYYSNNTEEDWGWHLHAGLTWKMTENWSQSLLLASSYRAADIMERFKYINLGGGMSLYGNPDLDPEQSYYAEYSLGYDDNTFSADLRLFANIITDYIAEDRSGGGNAIYLQNVDDARIYGAELETRLRLTDNWGLYGNVTGLYGQDKENNDALPGVAPVSGVLGVDFGYAGFWARLEGKGVAPQRRLPEGVDGTKGIVTMNAALGYGFELAGTKHEISVTVDNIFDTRYYNYLAHQRGYTVWEPGIAATLNYAVKF
ncbi:MAG: TonB-dependent receptor [Deltaproteobacteria bacterium]|jgi:hemoglobin/transferrin/lactoferrin receptor protein|nr:TonB-dependent receptor [Deltaproteobacteria bacterium]